MKRVVQRIGVLLATLLAVGGLGISMVNAQQSTGVANGFRISPVRSEIAIEKGKSQSITINIENPTDVATVAKPFVNDFVASDKEDGEPRLLLDDKAQSPRNDFKKLVGSIPDVELAAKAKKDVVVNITVPADAHAGGYYGAIRFAPSAPGQTSTVGLTASVGTIVLVTVPGNLKQQLDLVQLSGSQKGKAKRFFMSGQPSILVRLQNSGDIHVQPFGKILVKNMFGKTVYSYEFNNTQPRNNILPDSIRRFEDPLKAKRLFGRYTIEANLGYSQGSGNLISQKATFWYIPTFALYGIFILLVAIVGIVYWFIRRNKARKLHKHDVNKKKA